MGKIDDMRRQREQAFAAQEQREAKAAKTRPVDVAPRAESPVAPVARRAEPEEARPPSPKAEKNTKTTSSKTGAAIDEQGKCPDCGKMKPLANGVMASHQKGFGKACPGSRKKPV